MEVKQASSRNVLAGGLLVILATIIFGSFGLLVRFIKADAIILAWSLQVVGVICFAIYLLKNRLLFNYHGRKMLAAIFLMTASVTIADLSFFTALRLTSVSTAVFVKFLMPIFVVLLTLRSSSVSLKKLLLLLGLGMGGLFLILSSQGNILITANTGVLYALVTAFSLAFFIILFKKVSNTVPLPTILFYRYAIASVMLLPFIVGTNGVISQIQDSWLWLLGFGLLYAVIGTLIHAKGLKMTKVQYGAILGYMEPVAATVMSIVFLSEALTLSLALGGLLILLGSVLSFKS